MNKPAEIKIRLLRNKQPFFSSTFEKKPLFSATIFRVFGVLWWSCRAKTQVLCRAELSYPGFTGCSPIIFFQSTRPSWAYEMFGVGVGGGVAENSRLPATREVKNSLFIHEEFTQASSKIPSSFPLSSHDLFFLPFSPLPLSFLSLSSRSSVSLTLPPLLSLYLHLSPVSLSPYLSSPPLLSRRSQQKATYTESGSARGFCLLKVSLFSPL